MIILFLLILVIVLFVLYYQITIPTTFRNESLIGNNKCTWGPAYWCASRENAQECGLDWSECQKYVTMTPNSPNSPST